MKSFYFKYSIKMFSYDPTLEVDYINTQQRLNFSYIKGLKGIFTYFRRKQVVKNYIDYI